MVLIGSASKRIYGSLLNNHSETEIINENIFKKNIKMDTKKITKMAILILMVLWWTQITRKWKTNILRNRKRMATYWFGGVQNH
jgi:hypothetical protein